MGWFGRHMYGQPMILTYVQYSLIFQYSLIHDLALYIQGILWHYFKCRCYWYSKRATAFLQKMLNVHTLQISDGIKCWSGSRLYIPITKNMILSKQNTWKDLLKNKYGFIWWINTKNVTRICHRKFTELMILKIAIFVFKISQPCIITVLKSSLTYK